jgi:hypothetical protein
VNIIRILLIAGPILAASHARSAILVASTEEAAIIAREADGIWEVGRTYLGHRALPTGVLFGNSWRSLDAGSGHRLVVDGSGALFSWGAGNTAPGADRPLRIGSDLDWKSVSAGGNLSAAIKTNGSLWTWGEAIPREPASTGSSSPLAVGTGLDWKSVATGYLHRLAIRNDGSLWAWGYNSHGTLGDGTHFNRSAPVRIGTANDWASAAGGVYTSFAIKTDGSLWVWGDIFGAGTGASTTSDAPVRLGTDNDWRSIHPSASRNYVLAIKQDGSLWGWGQNPLGVLGLGDTVTRLLPTKVGTAVDWSEVAPGDLHVVATKTDGSIWHWGSLPSTQFPESAVPMDRSSSYVAQPQLRIEAERSGTMTSGGSWTLKTTILNEPTTNSLRVYNDGMAPLLISAINLPAGFTLDTAPSVIPPVNVVNCQVRLAVSAKGLYSGATHILSNQPGLPDFTLNLIGRVVSPDDDTDLDGINDAAEISLSTLGFDWNLAQPSLVETLRSKAEFAGFVPASRIFDIQLHVAAPVIDPAAETALLRIDLRDFSEGTSLPLEVEALAGPAGSGIKLDFPVPPDRDFVRIRSGSSD